MMLNGVTFDSDDWKAERQRRMALPLTDQEHPKGFKYESNINCIVLFWGGYAYEIDLDHIKRPEDVLWRLHHVCNKSWEGMTPLRISKLIEQIAHIKHWSLYERVREHEAPPPSKKEIAREREKLNPRLRYDVFKRDAHRCRSCGSSVSDGAHLQVDHIVPVSRGGLTVLSNLQTLCSACNSGKGDQ